MVCKCGLARYCSKGCICEDRNFHSKVCQLAYDSDDELDEVDLPDLEPRGTLRNIGNTCFMNAALQLLIAVSPVVKYVGSGAVLGHRAKDLGLD